jgi:1-acyl-sn-glycerol-3-phosphate acyltransferase
VFYSLLKLYARFTIRVYCSRIVIHGREWLHRDGPLLLAANHPNSFLDGMIVSTLFEKNIYSLARGDAFKYSFANRLLRYLHMLPVYRTSEGVGNLEHNYTTFSSCIEKFREQGIVLIFSEGGCINEWKLRPLRKGTARLATSTWKSGIPLVVVPLGINYSVFRKFGKEVHLRFGEPFGVECMEGAENEGRQLLMFNQKLQEGLEKEVYAIAPGDHKTVQKIFTYQPPAIQKILLFFPALLGVILHYPLYLFAQLIVLLRFKKSEHYDSVLVAILEILYPLYLAALIILGNKIYPLTGWSLLLASPVSLLALAKMNYFRK